MGAVDEGRRGSGWAMAVVAGICLVALGGYALFLLSERRQPVPAYPAASFGLSVAGATDPAAFRLVDEIRLTVEDLDTATASIESEVTVRAGAADGAGDDSSRPVAGTLLFALPAEARLDAAQTWTWPAGAERIVGVEPVVADAILDPDLLEQLPDRPTPVGTLNGRPLTILPADVAPPEAPPVRIIQVPVTAEEGTVTVRMSLTAPSTLFASAGRFGETAFAVDFGTTAATATATAPGSRAALDVRPLAGYADPLESASLVLTLGYPVELTESEIDAVPPVTRTAFEKVTWVEEVTEDGRLRVDGVLVDVPTRYWLGLLDNAALLLLGALVAVVIDRLLTR